MQIKKENKKINRKSQLMIVGSLSILIGMCIISSKYIYNYYLDRKEDIKIKEFYKEQDIIDKDSFTNNVSSDIVTNDNNVSENNTEIKKETKTNNKMDYVAVIKIPKINLEKGLCAKGSWCNDVNKNIQILNESDYPNSDNGNFILASHTGNSKVSYFKNLYKLNNNDEVSIVYNGSEYKYKVVNMYDILKTGTANIIRNKNKSTLTLITCRKGTDKQIIIICELIEKVEV